MHGSGTPRTARLLSSGGAGSGRSTRTRCVSISGDSKNGTLSVFDAAAGKARNGTGTRTPTRYASVNGWLPPLGERRIPAHTESGTTRTSRGNVREAVKRHDWGADSRNSDYHRVGFTSSTRNSDEHRMPRQTSTLLGVVALLSGAPSQRRRWTGSASISPRRSQEAGELR